MATHNGMLLGSCYYWVRDGSAEDGWILAKIDELWETELFKKCKKPHEEACGDYNVYRFDIWKQKKDYLHEKANERIEVLEKLGFRYFPYRNLGKENE